MRPTPIADAAPRSPRPCCPLRLSASAFEALRACPYRFFAARVLKPAASADELDAEIEKRDYGTWLHEVLHRVPSRASEPPRRPAADEARLLRRSHAAEASRSRWRSTPATSCRSTASFEDLVPRYIAWLHERERKGWRWLEGEVEREIEPPARAGSQA